VFPDLVIGLGIGFTIGLIAGLSIWECNILYRQNKRRVLQKQYDELTKNQQEYWL